MSCYDFIRRHHHRRRPGGSLARGPSDVRPGMKVAFVERKLFGGTCVNTGCMPTKTLVASAYAAHLARRGARLRRRARRAASRSTWRAVKARADAVVGQLAQRRRERGCAACERLHGLHRPRAFRSADDGPRRRERADGAAHLHQRRRARARARHAGRRRRCRSSPIRTILAARSPCRGISSSSAAAISGSNSRRCTGASAPRSRSSRWRRV